MTETKDFTVGAVVSAATGRLACDMGELYEILGWVLDDTLMTHQLPAAANAAGPHLYETFPWLRDIDLPEGGGDDFTAAILGLTDEHGGRVAVPRAGVDQHLWKTGNAIQDLIDLAGDRKVIGVQM